MASSRIFLNFILMKTVTVQIPDNVDVNDTDILIMLAAQLYEQGKLSLGQAAEMAMLTKRKFAESLGQYGVSLFNYPASELTIDIQNE